MKKMTALIALALLLSMLCLTGCAASAPREAALPTGGVLVLRVNPEIAVSYDENGLVTAVTARNDDALAVIGDCGSLVGQEARTAMTQLVTAIGQAGYFVEELEGEPRKITLEIEAGSALPSDTFLDDVVADIRDCIDANDWYAPMDVENESDYGITDYDDTDYGPNSDGVTDYDDNNGVTDYNDTDYGPNADGVTDYDDTDYGPNADGVTDYDDTDYGPNADGVTDYNDTDYGPDNDGVTDYNDTDYGPNADGVTDYNDTDYGPNSDGVTDYNDTDYGSDSVSDYGGSSDYDGGSSDYGASDYDD